MYEHKGGKEYSPIRRISDLRVTPRGSYHLTQTPFTTDLHEIRTLLADRELIQAGGAIEEVEYAYYY